MSKPWRVNFFAENPWNCECEHEWVGHWLKEAGLLSADTALLQCLIKCNYPPVQNCSTTAAERKGLITTCNPVGEEIEEPTKKQTNDFWMTAIACTLTAFVLVLLTISGWNLIKVFLNSPFFANICWTCRNAVTHSDLFRWPAKFHRIWFIWSHQRLLYILDLFRLFFWQNRTFRRA